MIKETSTRCQITLTEDSMKLLRAMQARTRKTKSELINEAIRDTMQRKLYFFERYDQTQKERTKHIIEKYAIKLVKSDHGTGDKNAENHAATLIMKVFEKLSKNHLMPTKINTKGFDDEAKKMYEGSPYAAELTKNDLPNIADTFDIKEKILTEIGTYHLQHEAKDIVGSKNLFAALGCNAKTGTWLFKVTDFIANNSMEESYAGEIICDVIASQARNFLYKILTEEK